jgi:hypothetical protein
MIEKAKWKSLEFSVLMKIANTRSTTFLAALQIGATMKDLETLMVGPTAPLLNSHLGCEGDR